MKRTFYTVGSLIILLICAFVFVLLPALAGGSKQADPTVFGKYNGKEIRYEQNSDFANFVSQYGSYYQSMGVEINDSNRYYIYNYAFNSTVSKMASEEAVKAAGYKPAEATVRRQMVPYFSDENGNYSKKAFAQASDAQKAELKAAVESSIIASVYQADNFGSSDLFGTETLYGLKESSAELDFLVAMGKETRGFDMAAFSLSEFPDSEKAAFGKEHSEKFIKYDMSVITVDDEATAKKVLNRLNAEEVTFADAVAEYSEKNYSDTDGKLVNVYAYQIENIMADAADAITVCSLKTGEMSGIVNTRSGYSIFKCDGDSVAADFNSEDMLKTVYSYLNSYESSVIENYAIGLAKDFIAYASMNGFDAACEKDAIDKDFIAPFPLNYGNVEVAGTLNTNVPGLATAAEDENFIKTAFSLKLNEMSEPIVLGTNVLILKCTEIGTAADDAEPAFDKLASFDQDSASDAIMNSPKLENNFAVTYISEMMN